VLTKFGMGIIHGDSNTRQCMATATVAYKESFGFDAPPYTYEDLEKSDCLVFVGANPCIAHPILWERVLMNEQAPEIVVIDPRKTETAMAATKHYAIKPKTDLRFFYGLAHILIRNDWVDHQYIERHTQGFNAFKRHVEPFTPERVSQETGLTVVQIQELAALIHNRKRVSFWWTMGVNHGYEAVRTTQAIINIALMTGNIGRPGTGANSITGQCNAMGSRLFSNTTNLLGCHDFSNAGHRQKIASILDIDCDRIPPNKGMAYDQIVEGIVQNKIKGLWVIGTNPAHSWINRNELQKFMGNLDFLVVQDMYASTETAQRADLVLPAAGWGEKPGSFINSERRIGLIKKVAEPPGDAKTDFDIFKLIAEYWGCGPVLKDWHSVEDVFRTLKEISRGQPCDITGIRDYHMLDECGGIQWPLREGEALCNHQRRLFEDGRFFHEDGKALFIFEAVRNKPEEVSVEFPFELLTGRGTSSQWHTQTRTGKSKILRKMYPENVYIEINPDDASGLNISHAQWVHVSTRRGKVRAQAAIVPTINPGQIFMPMHYA
ncbi:MAG: molybdopterin-dependent oxidoreductase, partial [Candidatus Omnitrophica bacterium]|nr:molybdopterin-dependent oxidoreductase [Candidatus Omnitrophota bacterium]